MTSVLVSVVIPSVLRPEITRAIKSAKDQVINGAVEVVVIADRDESRCSPAELNLLSDADVVEFTGGGRRGGYARNRGTERSSGTWIAFLDDDDEWEPNKLAIQMECLRERSFPEDLVVATRVKQRVRGRDELSAAVPYVCFSDGPVESYLFRRRLPTLGRAGIWPSSILLARSLALEVKWDETLARHQDWDWLIRLERDGKAAIVQIEQAPVIIEMGTIGSISASSDWGASIKWAKSNKNIWSTAVFADFVAGQCLRYALQSRSAHGVRLCLLEIASVKKFPAFGPAVLGLGGLVPRKIVLQISMLAQRYRTGGKHEKRDQ